MPKDTDLLAALKHGAADAELLQAYPEAAKEKDIYGRLLLHWALKKDASEAVVLALLQAYPEAIKEKDEDGNLPLHWAVEKGASEAVVLALLQAYPEATKEKGLGERLPLHCAFHAEETGYIKATKVKGESLEVGAKVIYEGREMVVSRGVDSEDELKLKPAVSEEVILALLHAYPEAAEEKDKEGRLPLHCAGSGASEAVVAALQHAYPEAATEKDKEGRLPLHCAVARGMSEAVVAALLRAYPEAIKEKDNRGRLPLHCAVENGASESVVLALLQAHPEAVKEKDKDKRLPLHCAGSGASEAVVAALQHAYPEAATEKDKEGRLPLHCAVARGASEAVVAALLRAYPEAIKEKDEDGKLPLQWAVSKGMSEAVKEVELEIGAKVIKRGREMVVSQGDPDVELKLKPAVNEEVILALLQAYPEAAEEKDKEGRLPLHCAVASGASEAVVATLLRAYPEAVKEEDKDKRLPLHCVRKGTSEAVVAALLQAYPEAAEEKDRMGGKLPLHCAVENGASEAVVLALLQAYLEAVKERGRDFGMLPLHCAVKGGASEAVVLALLQAYPEAIKEMDNCGRRGRLPLHWAVENDASEAVVAVLLAADMPLRLDGGAPVDHAGSWLYAVASTDEGASAAVRRVLASKSDDPPGHGFGVHIHALVKVNDEEGRTALELSTAGPRKAIYLHLLFCGRYELTIGAPEHRSATSVVLRALDRGEKTDYGKVFDDADTDKSGTLEREELAPVAASIGLDAELFLRAEDKSIDRSSFVGICKQQLGDGQRSVVIKLMQEKEQWERERDARAKNQLDSRFVVQELPGVPSDKAIAAAVLARGGGLGAIAEQYLPKGISLGTRAIIMDAADRNLHHIFLQERPDLNGVRAILQQVFESVAHLHAKGLMHGDLKLLNVVRFRRDNRLRLIDLDAAARISDTPPYSYAGAKFSSAVLPPEHFHELKQGEAEALEAYWQGAGEETNELRVKVAPMVSVAGKQFVVKSFFSSEGKPVREGLPYGLVEAAEEVDLWSLGALAFLLLAGEPLVPSTRDDDCASGDAAEFLYRWDDSRKLRRLKKITHVAANDLIGLLLQLEPSARPRVATLLKEHPFFHPESGDAEMKKKLDDIESNQAMQIEMLARIDANVDIIKELSIENKRELRRTRDVLLKGFFEASEVMNPTTFIVVLKKLPEAPNEKEKAKLLKIAADGSGVTLGNDTFSLTFTGDSAGVGGKYVDTLNTGMKWLRRLKTIGSKMAAGKVGEAFETIKEGLDDLVTGETMFLYLVDELTGEPVRDPSGHYPIEIKTPSDVVPRLLPVMQVGLRAMSVFNGAAGVARMFGYPVPTVPAAWAAGARESVALLKQQSSVEQFSVVHEEVVKDRDAKEITDTSKEQKSVRGASLRELQRFFEKHDATKGYAGLRRIVDEDGTALWTALTDSSAVKAAIEARAKERREEERRGDELLQQALELSLAPAAAAAAGALSGGQQMPHVVVSTAGAVEAAVAEVAAAAKAAVALVAEQRLDLAAELASNQQQQQQRLDSHESQLSELQNDKNLCCSCAGLLRSIFSLGSRGRVREGELNV